MMMEFLWNTKLKRVVLAAVVVVVLGGLGFAACGSPAKIADSQGQGEPHRVTIVVDSKYVYSTFETSYFKPISNGPGLLWKERTWDKDVFGVSTGAWTDRSYGNVTRTGEGPTDEPSDAPTTGHIRTCSPEGFSGRARWVENPEATSYNVQASWTDGLGFSTGFNTIARPATAETSFDTDISLAIISGLQLRVQAITTDGVSPWTMIPLTGPWECL
jgi:hypothetical protein